jgi:hypothetical protein
MPPTRIPPAKGIRSVVAVQLNPDLFGWLVDGQYLATCQGNDHHLSDSTLTTTKSSTLMDGWALRRRKDI